MEESEIAEIVGKVEEAEAPENATELIKFACGTAGKIPYYWGGKQTVKNGQEYTGFSGTPTEYLTEKFPHLGNDVSTSNGIDSVGGHWSDVGGTDRGEIIGLDCSGWACFVHQAFGRKISGGTQSLADSGLPNVRFEDLQPGDLIIAPSSHVVMFVCWDGDPGGTYCTIEETGGSINNVVFKRGVNLDRGKYSCYKRVG